MYYLTKLREKIRVPPQNLVMDEKEAIKAVLKAKYEKTITKDYGLIVEIKEVTPLSEGVVIPGDANVYYEVEYEAITFNVEVNEVFLGRVREVVEFGAFVNIGPFEALLHISQISKEMFKYNKKNKSLVSRDGKKVIKKGDLILAKVSTVSMKGSLADVKISLTMRDEGLGKVEWLKEKKKPKQKAKKQKKKEAKKK